MNRKRTWRVAGAGVLAVAVAAAALVVRQEPARLRLTVHFPAAVGIHAGSEVRVLGVEVGEVVAVTPQGRGVRVELRYDPAWPVPADAKALIVPPSVVSDRYVQLTPAYTGGPALPDGAELPAERTSVPIELDEVYRSLDELSTALGPQGANADGALRGLVRTGAANLRGNGDELHQTLSGLSQAMSTLSAGRDDLFGSVADLQQFTSMLAAGDGTVREFDDRLAAVSEQLAAEREDLAAAVRALSRALADVAAFVKANRAELKANVAALADLTGVLARQQQALTQVLDMAPLALSNLNLAYNPRSGTIDTRDNALGPYEPASFVCSLLVSSVPVAQVPAACTDLAKTLETAKLPLTAELKKLLQAVVKK
ncbi:MCE family protein [Catellatospora chokoriensis]|uniref:ABC transporter substrate-binding protein n=1 Tax=Catellatospora chokoriensis TaxID=310353 RepID=A0A8J3NQZ7_9ACTN|nr:MCE family protein [Catellatospora chokoriensis]GIF89440.1 ABC transporter substrate-binding protein [Catellatospora chokoriensis]